MWNRKNRFWLGAQCKNEKGKKEFMKKKKKLGTKSIYIDNDLTHMERIIRDKLKK